MGPKVARRSRCQTGSVPSRFGTEEVGWVAVGEGVELGVGLAVEGAGEGFAVVEVVGFGVVVLVGLGVAAGAGFEVVGFGVVFVVVAVVGVQADTPAATPTPSSARSRRLAIVCSSATRAGVCGVFPTLTLCASARYSARLRVFSGMDYSTRHIRCHKHRLRVRVVVPALPRPAACPRWSDLGL